MKLDLINQLHKIKLKSLMRSLQHSSPASTHQAFCSARISIMAKTSKYPHRIEFRATAEEYQRAEHLASQSDLTVSDLLRVLLQQAESTDPARSQQLIQLYQRLGNIAKNLNQLNTNYPSKSGSTSLDEAVELINDARKLIVQSIQ
ncbi:MAG: hypothetical protein J0L70_23955 [Leptolyngbya sp. UWPOB_LEPTO1]|nr:hypothetical protein [Leptolyngbya sp. UWPOB_LEPTO1]